jgi:hypothetical protein
MDGTEPNIKAIRGWAIKMKVVDLIKAMAENKNVGIYAVHNNLTAISRGNGKKKPSKITVAINDEDVDLFFGISNTLATPSEKGIAFMVVLDERTVNEIVKNDKNND